MPTVSVQYDIKSLIERYAGVKIAGSAYANGVLEYHSNCPFCGGTDRFVMRPSTGQYSCAIRSSGCGEVGDGIDFLVKYMNMTRRDAIEELGLEDVSFYEGKSEQPRNNGNYNPPPKGWQTAATIFIAKATEYLWSGKPDANRALEYLHGRGLTDATIKNLYIGYVPLQPDGRWYSDSFEGWGLKPEDLTETQRAKGCIRIPNGILIPWFDGTTIWKLAVKRPGETPDYGQVIGSADGLYNAGSLQPGKPAMIVEGEFDAAAIEQCAGDLVSVIATGGTSKGHNLYWAAELLEAEFLAQAFDDDPSDEKTGLKAGDEGAKYWVDLYEHCFRFEPVEAKDANDMLQQYGREYVRDWAQAALDTWRAMPNDQGAITYHYVEGSAAAPSLEEPPAREETPAFPVPESPIETPVLDAWDSLGEDLIIVPFDEDTPSYGHSDANTAVYTAPVDPPASQFHTRGIEWTPAVLDKIGAPVLPADIVQDHLLRLTGLEKVETPKGTGRIWDPQQLQVHVERGKVRVTLTSTGTTELFAPELLQPISDVTNLELW